MENRPIITLNELEGAEPQQRGHERIYTCPICGGGSKKEKSLHVNTDTGAFNCKRASCSTTGKLKEFWRSNAANLRSTNIKAIKPPAKPDTAFRIDFTREGIDKSDWMPIFTASMPITGTQGAAYLARRGISGEIAESAGCRFFAHSQRLRVLFPFQRDGETVAFQSRAIDGGENPHYARGKKSLGAFITSPEVLKSEVVVLVEAPIDALSLATAGIDSVALGGTSAGDWLLHRLAFRKVLLAFDNDENGAGDKAAAKLAEQLGKFGAPAARLAPPRQPEATKADWNDVLQEYGTTIVKAFVSSKIALINKR